MNWIDVKSLGITEIMKILPHRYPFLLVDRVLEIKTGKPLHAGMTEQELADARKGTMARTIKNVTVNEGHFQGHFPENPILPGVLTLEALAQSAVFTAVPFVAFHSQGRMPALRVALAGFDDVRFRRPVIPGDRLEMTVVVKQTKGSLWSIDGLVEVDGKKVAEGRLLAQLLYGEPS